MPETKITFTHTTGMMCFAYHLHSSMQQSQVQRVLSYSMSLSRDRSEYFGGAAVWRGRRLFCSVAARYGWMGMVASPRTSVLSKGGVTPRHCEQDEEEEASASRCVGHKKSRSRSLSPSASRCSMRPPPAVGAATKDTESSVRLRVDVLAPPWCHAVCSMSTASPALRGNQTPPPALLSRARSSVGGSQAPSAEPSGAKHRGVCVRGQ